MTDAGTLNRVERACAQLRHDAQAITFTALARRTGLGRTTLYRDPAIRAIIEEHRRRAATSGNLAGITDEIATLRAALDTLATQVRRHEEQLRQLKSRNS